MHFEQLIGRLQTSIPSSSHRSQAPVDQCQYLVGTCMKNLIFGDKRCVLMALYRFHDEPRSQAVSLFSSFPVSRNCTQPNEMKLICVPESHWLTSHPANSRWPMVAMAHRAKAAQTVQRSTVGTSSSLTPWTSPELPLPPEKGPKHASSSIPTSVSLLASQQCQFWS
ncbi:uncharacterized protein BCR38DRAFT_217304 [Pseudomassariella vexata]|uniref:Uncharacterized protein n=1 Tax=Pseudomassariella vexata TaxID=1141098 RepID=A0A1Y2DUF6_9PEZI|nr:uncharacterized protein BCR38DRAFT_217304 [Pseudomassariella vexata]ORY62913.1 hypothetical protein BCR38DRAFT_217304 [Pseudomassariella vexata]